MTRSLFPVFYLFVILVYCSCDNDNNPHPQCEGGGGHGNGPPPSGPGGTHPPPSGSGPTGPGGSQPGGPNGPGGSQPGGPNGPGGSHHGGPNGPSGSQPGGPNGPGGSQPGGPNGPGGSHHGGPNGPGGCPNEPGGSHGHNGKLTVMISFDSLDKPSQHFFIHQLQPRYGELSKCVDWEFVPCSTSHIVKEVLDCKDGVAECQIDVLHACAAHFYQNDQYKLGTFFICMMTNENQYVKGEGCAKAAEMDWCRLNTCQPKKDAAELCDNRFKFLNSLHETKIPGIMFNRKADVKLDNAAANDLKGTICEQLQKNNVKCDACGSSGSGGGHGNGPNGGGHGPSSGSHGPSSGPNGPSCDEHGHGPDSGGHGPNSGGHGPNSGGPPP